MAKKVKGKKTGSGKQAGATRLTRLRAPEKKLAACVKRGEPCIFDPSTPEKTRTLRAGVIERLVRGQRLPGEKAALDLPSQGLVISGAWITGPLDLSCCDCPARLGWVECGFDDPIDLMDARLRGLFLSGSSLNGLEAGRLTVEGSLIMRDIRSNREVNLIGATITGNLDLRDATLENTDKDDDDAKHALILDQARIGGNAFLDQGFSAKGPVRLLGASITGNLSLRGATLENTDKDGAAAGDALSLDRARIGGNVNLDEGFSAKGAVRLHGAAITGNLSLSSATLENIDKDAAAAGDALNLQKLTVSGVCFFESLAQPPIGHVDLYGMTALELVDDGSLWPEKGQGDLWLDGFTYQRFLNCETGWRFRQSWLLRQTPRNLKRDFAPQPWVQCAKVLREMGHERDARLLLYQMHEARRRALKINWRKFHTIRFWKNCGRSLGSQVFRVTAGHGYRPGLSLAWIAGIMVFGAVIFFIAQATDRMTPAKERFYLNKVHMQKYREKDVLPAGYPKFSPILYSIDVFLPIVSFSQEDHWRPANLPLNERLQIRWWNPWTWNKYRFYNRLHIILGWFFTSIAVLAFTGVIKRD